MKSAPADRVLYGPVDVAGDISDAGFHLELDTSKPVVVSSKGSDIIFSACFGVPRRSGSDCPGLRLQPGPVARPRNRPHGRGMPPERGTKRQLLVET